MRKNLFFAALLISAATSWGQRGNLTPATGSGLTLRSALPSTEKTMLCNDTLRYSQAKEQILGTNTFYTGFAVWQEDGEAVSQTFLNSGTLSITGIEFFGANNASAEPSVTVSAAIYSVNASNIPTTLLGSGSITISATTYAYRYVNFATPVTVTGNYAVVLTPTNTDGILDLYINDEEPGQSYDELYTRFYSSYPAYPEPDTWMTIPVLSEDALNFEAIMAPIVNYSINAGFTATPTTVCQGTPVAFANTTTPASALSNRMMNYQAFRTFFGTAPSDSTFVYDHDNGSPLSWTANHSYTYPAAGSYDVEFGVNAGFWSSCFDNATHTVTVNATPATPAITPAGPVTVCQGTPVTLTSSAATGNTWSNAATTATISVTSSGTYTTSVTANGCTSPASNAVMVTITPIQDASFTYPAYTLCSGSSNVTATPVTAGGAYSSTTGLVINATTGEIDINASTDGTYTVTYTTSGTCPGTSTKTITITSAPDASFSYASASYCMNGTDPSPTFDAGASGGAFSSTAGLTINAGTGTVDLSASTAGTYTVTNTIAASGSCPAASETATITVDAPVAPSFAAVAPVCAGSTIAALPATSTNSITGTWSPAINNMSTTTYTFTPDAGMCANQATMTITVNQPAAPAFAADGPYCEGATIPALPTTSTNGVTGTWSPAINNAATTTYTFTPAGSECASAATLTITINDQTAPSFTAIADLCQDATAPALPASSNNGVSGTWSPATISTATVGTATYTFTPTAGQCAETAALTVTVNDCLSVDENVFGDLSVFPNPATNDVTISFTNAAFTDIEMALLTNDGKVVSSRMIKANTTFSEKIDLSSVAKGVYFVRLNSDKGTVIQKIVKQ